MRAESDRLPPDVAGAEIPAEFFGMHLVRVWSPGTPWPAAPIGLYRMANATHRWHELHLGEGRWKDDPVAGIGMSRTDAVLRFRDLHASGTPTIYTLGGGDHDHWGGFPAWLGSARSDTIAEWRRFVREVGTRFRGRIRYWEIWNEPDFVMFYRGTIQRLVELTRAASEELRAIDANNVIIGPSFTDAGLNMMANFLAAGGGRYVDIIGWHQDNNAVPERDTVHIKRARQIMRQNGVGHLPLWTTEGHARLEAGGDAAGVVARTYLVLWAFGVKSFSWYAWDMWDYGPEFPGPWVTLVEPGNAAVPSDAGRAYAEIARWLQGSRMIDLEVSGDLWTVQLTLADGRQGWIVWQTGKKRALFRLPEGVSRFRTLDGGERAWQYDSYAATQRPVLFW